MLTTKDDLNLSWNKPFGGTEAESREVVIQTIAPLLKGINGNIIVSNQRYYDSIFGLEEVKTV